MNYCGRVDDYLRNFVIFVQGALLLLTKGYNNGGRLRLTRQNYWSCVGNFVEHGKDYIACRKNVICAWEIVVLSTKR